MDIRWKTSPGPLPVGQRHSDDLDVRPQQLFELPDPLVVGAIAAADRRGAGSGQATSPPSMLPAPEMLPSIFVCCRRRKAAMACGSVRRWGLPMLQRMTPRSVVIVVSRG
jgi:hypothetical protein